MGGFRRLWPPAPNPLQGATEPAAARLAESYRLRSGGALAPARLSFEEVMRERFGSVTGRVET
jgi:hypothetical protein